MGTSGYMSPEQARGLSVDGRTDIWSLGVVIYEMVTGEAPFKGETTSDVIVSILEREPPPLAQLAPEVPAELQRIISKTLHKDREGRYQTAKDLVIDLKSLKQDLELEAKLEQSQQPGSSSRGRLTPSATAPAARPQPRWWTNRLIWLSAAVILVVGVAVSFYLYRLSSGSSTRTKSESSLPPMKVVPFTTFPGNELFPAFSPDGKKIAFSWAGEKDDNRQIYIKQVEAGIPFQLTIHPEDMSPVWSPDGSYIAFSRLSETDGGIYVIPAMGGAERRVYSTKWDTGRLACIDWSPDGKLLALQDRDSPQEPGSIFLLSLQTLEKRKLTSPPDPHWDGDRHPVFSPDGQTLAFLRDSSVDTDDIYLVPVAGGEPRRLTFDNTLLYSALAWTMDGRDILFSSKRGGNNLRVWRVSVSGGTPEPVAVGGEQAIALTISRQGNRLAYVQASPGNDDIWRIEISKATGRGSSTTKFIASTRDDSYPQYSPDGKRIAFASERSGSMEIWRCDTDGSNPIELTSFGGPFGGAPHWSPDSRWIAFDSRPEGHSQIYVINSEGGQPRRITTGNANDVAPSWSKDGKWIYFSSNRGGQQQIWKGRVEGGEAVRVTERAALWGVESPDGKFFYYEGKTADTWGIWRIPVGGGPETFVVNLRHFRPFGWSGRPGNWEIVERGIYFIKPDATPQPDIEFYSFATGQVRQIATIAKERVLRGLPGVAVSPDGRWILYTEGEGEFSSDIMLVENFH